MCSPFSFACCGFLQAATQFQNLYEMFIATDATQVEINPLAVGGVPGRGEGGQSA